LGFVVSISACKKKKTEEPVAPVVQTNDVTPAKSVVLKKGTFSSYDHSLGGEAHIVKDSTGNVILRLEKFTMTSGPDVDLLLSKTSSYSSSNVIKIADLDGSYSNNALNIDIDDKIDLGIYKHVIVYCAKFSVSFGDAEPK
jgi:hypothetical protein